MHQHKIKFSPQALRPLPGIQTSWPALLGTLISLIFWSFSLLKGQQPQAPQDQNKQGCAVEDRFFEEEVWSKVGERTCIRCHTSKGDAAESDFILSLSKDTGVSDATTLSQNRSAFDRMGTKTEGDGFRLLKKARGELDHGGGTVLQSDSTAFRILERYVRRINRLNREPLDEALMASSGQDSRPFFEGVEMMSPTQLARRVTLSLCGRLPTKKEINQVQEGGQVAIDALLDTLMSEEAFYTRLKEGFNDIFLTLGIEDNAETILSYEHFEQTRLWTEQFDLSHIPEADRQKARWALADVYRKAILQEPLELIAYIVRNDRPFSELVTADYMMVSPYTARGYGIFNQLEDRFQNVDDPFEYLPAELGALKSRDGKTQDSGTGFYPHSGFLGLFHYLHRYPSTDTNRNRLRARMVYQHFLGIDIMQLAPRSTDASAVATRFKVPTMEAQDCVVCHRSIDPVAGIFQDYNNEGNLGPKKDGWYADMFKSGFEGEDLPASERWRAPQWLGERIAKDARFPIAMVEHVYYLLMGRKVLTAPDDIESPTFLSRLRAYKAQRKMIEEVAQYFKQTNLNLKAAFKRMIASDFYRVKGLQVATENPLRRAELDDLGIIRLLSPEQLERKIEAIFGKRWGRLNDELRILYGGIDSQTVTDRNADPSGAMGSIQRIMANDLACLHVATDFRLKPSERRLFPGIEPTVVPGNAASNQQIRKTVVDLHTKILGRESTPGDPEVDRTLQLFRDILKDAKERGNYPTRETYFCGGREDFQTEDPLYTIRAWRAVVSYLLRQHDFLYE